MHGARRTAPGDPSSVVPGGQRQGGPDQSEDQQWAHRRGAANHRYLHRNQPAQQWPGPAQDLRHHPASRRRADSPPNLAGTPPSVRLQWNASFDEAAGETDVTQYNIYRRLLADPGFGSALLTIPAGQPSPYVFVDNGVTRGTDYVYGVGAQDCTPSESVRLISFAVRPN